MAFDSTIRLKQINNPEISGYILNVVGNIPVTTGTLTGVFYPYYQNPSGYIGTGVTGQFATISFVNTSVNSSAVQTLIYVAQNYLPISTILTSSTGIGAYLFQTPIQSGISTQFVQFPTSLGNNPYVTATLNNNLTGDILAYQISGVTSSGFFINLSDVTQNTGFIVTTFAGPSNTGFVSTTIISNNTYYTTGGSGAYMFQTSIQSGVNTQFISFPQYLGNNPFVTVSLSNNLTGDILAYQISGVKTGGFSINFSDFTQNTGFVLTSFVGPSNTGFFATNIVSNVTGTQSFVTGITSGVNAMFITFPSAFPSTPVVTATLEVTSQILYSYGINGRTRFGFNLWLSDNIQESGVYLNVIAKV